MYNNSHKKSFGSKGGFGGKKFGGGAPWKHGTDDRPALFTATCVKCQATCEVPFRPNGKKPVFCRDCFRKDEGATPSHRSAPSAGGSGNGEILSKLKALNDKMDQILNALTESKE